MPRPPSTVLIVDSNVILSIAFGLRSRPVFELVNAERALVASAASRQEVLSRTASVRAHTHDAVEVASLLLELIDVADESLYVDRLVEAAEALRVAPASRNGSTRDAHVLAVAWTFDADIWSHDRDFAGTGWPTWSNANLYRALVPGS